MSTEQWEAAAAAHGQRMREHAAKGLAFVEALCKLPGSVPAR